MSIIEKIKITLMRCWLEKNWAHESFDWNI